MLPFFFHSNYFKNASDSTNILQHCLIFIYYNGMVSKRETKIKLKSGQVEGGHEEMLLFFNTQLLVSLRFRL